MECIDADQKWQIQLPWDCKSVQSGSTPERASTYENGSDFGAVVVSGFAPSSHGVATEAPEASKPQKRRSRRRGRASTNPRARGSPSAGLPLPVGFPSGRKRCEAWGLVCQIARARSRPTQPLLCGRGCAVALGSKPKRSGLVGTVVPKPANAAQNPAIGAKCDADNYGQLEQHVGTSCNGAMEVPSRELKRHCQQRQCCKRRGPRSKGILAPLGEASIEGPTICRLAGPNLDRKCQTRGAKRSQPFTAPCATAPRKKALMRVCQPGPVIWTAASMSASTRIFSVGRVNAYGGGPGAALMLARAK